MRKFICFILLLICVENVVFAAPSSIHSMQKTIKINNQNKTVNVVTVDLNSSNIELGVTIANDKIGTTEDFSSMIKRKNAVAAINANYFDAYKTLEPIGPIMVDKEFKHLEGNSVSLVISNKKDTDIANHQIKIDGYLNGFKSNQWNTKTDSMGFYLFDIWYINNIPKDPLGVYLFTPERGNSINLNGGTAIEVINNKITKIVTNPKQTTIPKNGYIIYYGSDPSFTNYIKARFKVGQIVELEYDISKFENQKTKDNKTYSSKQTKLFGSVNKLTENNWPTMSTFNVWLINSKPTDSQGVYLYTPEIGSSIKVNSGHAVTVENNKITKIEFDVENIKIPEKGFIIYYGKDATEKKYLTSRFDIGFTIDFYHEKTLQFDTENIIKEAVANNSIALKKVPSPTIKNNDFEGMISAGPHLIENSKIIFNPNKTEFKEDKIVRNRAQRSAVGTTKDNKLLLVTGTNLNMSELAEVMFKLGATNAMNLDGGASSGLYANGKMITKPGRKLHTVLMIYDKNIK